MIVKVLYFARLREILGTSEETLDLPQHVHTLAQLKLHLAERNGVWEEAFKGALSLRAAVNQELVSDETVIQAGDEIALFPPVTGG